MVGPILFSGVYAKYLFTIGCSQKNCGAGTSVLLKPASLRPHAKPPLVLVVDGCIAGRRAMERMLTVESSYEVVFASTGEQAILRAAMQPVAAVLLAAELPDMLGWVVVEELGSRQATAHVPVIIVAASDDEPTKTRCRSAGCVAVLSKPVLRDVLLENLLCVISDNAAQPNYAQPVNMESRQVTIVVDSTVADLVPSYLANRRKDLVEMLRLLDLREYKGIQRMGHNMKGSGTSYGMPEVSQIGSQLEAAGAARDDERVLQLRGELQLFVESIALNH